MDSKRNFKLDSRQYRNCLRYLNAYLLVGRKLVNQN